MQIATRDLTKHALDWVVATCEGYGAGTYMKNIDVRLDVRGKVSCLLIPIDRVYKTWSPSIDWSQAGPIIEREEIDVVMVQRDLKIWSAEMPHSPKGDYPVLSE